MELGERLARIDWKRVERDLDAWGHARLPGLLSASECRALAALYDDPSRFRKSIDMEPRRFGRGQYRYLSYPLPRLVQSLRTRLYRPLARVANRWQERLGGAERFEPGLNGFLERCHQHGQTRPTPLLLRYADDGWNNLHQDLYGKLAFPLQLTCLLSRPGADFEGGEFLLAEQRPRQQTRALAVALARGEGIVFPSRERPVEGARGVFRAAMRHGVSRVRGGRRMALGVIFHDAA